MGAFSAFLGVGILTIRLTSNLLVDFHVAASNHYHVVNIPTTARSHHFGACLPPSEVAHREQLRQTDGQTDGLVGMQ